MDRIVFRTRFLLLWMAMFLLTFGMKAQALEVIPMTLEETAYHADAIFVGRITGAQSRWGSPAKRWMVTDYAFEIEETILANAEVKTGHRITLPFWGGVIGNEGQGLGGLSHPVNGQRYLIMLRPDYRGYGATPAVGVTHGLLQVVALPNGVEELREYEGQPLYRAANGAFLRREFLPQNSKETAGVTRPAFTDWLRRNLKRIKATPPPVRPAPDMSDPRLLRPVGKTPIFDSSEGGLGILGDSVSPLTTESSGLTSPLPDTPELTNSFRAPEKGAQAVNIHRVNYVINRGAVVPLVFNQLPATFTPWSPEDQFQMANWNYYGSDVFRVRANPTGTFAWQDNVSDIAGFINETTLNNVYGLSWAGGVLAWCSSRWFTNNNLIVESDISLNVGVGWTMDQNWILDGSTAFSYRQVLSHELGHAHGLGHEDTFISLMRANVPGNFAAFSAPFMDNAEAIRANYPARTVNRTDLAIYLFNRASNGTWTEMTFPSTVVAGNNFTVNDYHLENTGTTTINTPTLEWYLTRQRDYNAAYYGLGTTTYSALTRFNYFFTNSVSRTLNVPTGVPAGEYYLNAFIGNDAGVNIGAFPFSNNYGWSRTKITVRPRLLSVSLNPSTVTGGQSSTGTVTLSSATPSALTIFPTSSNYSFANPGSAAISAGSSTGTFAISTAETATTRNITIGASLYGVSANATLTVQANIFAPTRLAASAVSANQIDLSWQDLSSIESGYRIERKEGVSGTWEEIAVVGAGVTAYSDTSLVPLTLYLYRVRAYNGGTNSNYTNEAAARTRQSLFTISGRVTDRGRGLSTIGMMVSGVNTAAIYFDGISGAAINDNSTVENTIAVPNSGSLQDVHVAVNITHTYIGDLRATLIAPDGTPIILHNRAGGGTDNLITLYPDATASAEDLAALAGKEINGNWTLRVEDLAGGDTGTFNSWSLELNYTGDYPAYTYTDFDGYYAAAVPAGTYMVMPDAFYYYEFSPVSQTVTVTNDVANIDFAAVASTNNSISGRVTTAGGTGVPNVLVQAYANLSSGYIDAHSPGLPITDFSTQTDTITVPTEGIVTGVHVGVNLTHTYQGDLRVTLIAPNGTEVILHNRTGSGTDNLVTTYPDLTASAEDLAVLNGSSMTGNWTLRVEDLGGGDSGTFNVWSLTLDYNYGLLLGQEYTQSDGTYLINGLPEVTYDVIPYSASFGFTPLVQTVTLAPSATNVDFVADGTVVAVSGIVELQQVVNSAQPITFEFREPGGATLFTETQTLGAGGEFALAVPAGSYDLAIKGGKWLRQVVAVDASAGDVSGVSAQLRAGDANDDNYADISDLLLLVGAYNQAAPSAGYLEAADFNCDTVNDIGDLLLLISNYNQQGDP